MTAPLSEKQLAQIRESEFTGDWSNTTVKALLATVDALKDSRETQAKLYQQEFAALSAARAEVEQWKARCEDVSKTHEGVSAGYLDRIGELKREVERLQAQLQGFEGMQGYNEMQAERDSLRKQLEKSQEAHTIASAALAQGITENESLREKLEEAGAEVERLKVDHHTLGRWPECKFCVKFYADDMEAAYQHGEICSKLGLREEDATNERLYQRIAELVASEADLSREREVVKSLTTIKGELFDKLDILRQRDNEHQAVLDVLIQERDRERERADEFMKAWTLACREREKAERERDEAKLKIADLAGQQASAYANQIRHQERQRAAGIVRAAGPTPNPIDLIAAILEGQPEGERPVDKRIRCPFRTKSHQGSQCILSIEHEGCCETEAAPQPSEPQGACERFAWAIPAIQNNKPHDFKQSRDVSYCECGNFLSHLCLNCRQPFSAHQEPQGEKPAEPQYPCADCGVLRTKAEGGTTFTVCDECWDRRRAAERAKDSKPTYVELEAQLAAAQAEIKTRTLDQGNLTMLNADLRKERNAILASKDLEGGLIAAAHEEITSLNARLAAQEKALALADEMANIWSSERTGVKGMQRTVDAYRTLRPEVGKPKEGGMKIVLCQAHPIKQGAEIEVVIKDEHSFLVWAGNLKRVDNPRAYYSPDEGDAIRARKPEEPKPATFTHAADCMARDESDTDYAIRMVNLGPCPCETKPATCYEAVIDKGTNSFDQPTFMTVPCGSPLPCERHTK